jgi:hypothetical protein
VVALLILIYGGNGLGGKEGRTASAPRTTFHNKISIKDIDHFPFMVASSHYLSNFIRMPIP